MPVDDSYSVALLHGEGADASTTITDESGKTWTVAGGAQIDTAQYKFGEASILFDGTGDYIYSADHADWRLDGGSNSNQWTIDAWLRFSSLVADMGLFAQYVSTNTYWSIFKKDDDLNFRIFDGGSIYANLTWSNFLSSISANEWFHLAMVKNGTSGYMPSLNGTFASAQTASTPMLDYSAALRIGYHNGGTARYMTGWMDEIRISKGIARWTADFTPPTQAYRAIALSAGNVPRGRVRYPSPADYR